MEHFCYTSQWLASHMWLKILEHTFILICFILQTIKSARCVLQHLEIIRNESRTHPYFHSMPLFQCIHRKCYCRLMAELSLIVSCQSRDSKMDGIWFPWWFLETVFSLCFPSVSTGWEFELNLFSAFFSLFIYIHFFSVLIFFIFTF